jgi:flagellar biosynthesis/type III secretory pathway protein FliH
MTIASVSTTSNAIQTAVESKLETVNMQVAIKVLNEELQQNTKTVSELTQSTESSTYEYGADGRSSKPGAYVNRLI